MYIVLALVLVIVSIFFVETLPDYIRNFEKHKKETYRILRLIGLLILATYLIGLIGRLAETLIR